MSERTRARISIHLTNGEKFEDFESFSLRERFDDPLGSYTLVIRPGRDRLDYVQRNFQKGELLKIKINEKPRASVIIVTVVTAVSKSGSITVTVTCASLLHTATQSSADPTIFKAQPTDVPIQELILEIMRPFGFDIILTTATKHIEQMLGVKLNGRAADLKSADLKIKDAQVQENELAYTYCARISSRLGVALKISYEGILLLMAPDYQQHAIYSLVDDLSSAGDVMISYTLSETNDGQFSKVVIRGKEKSKRKKTKTAQPQAATRLKKLTGRFATDAQEAAAQAKYEAFSALQPFGSAVETQIEPGQPFYTSSVHPFKPKYFTDKRARDNIQCASFCKLVHTKPSPKTFMLTVVIDGISSRNTGAIWSIDTVCGVVCELLGIDENMWVYEVSMNVSKSSGPRTTLKLLPLNALILGDIPG